MIMLNNPLGQDPMDFNDSTAADRIGRKIREIRESQNLSQSELGEKLGLNADRIQKYENGARKPKPELLKQFANALGVTSLALTDAVVSNYLGAMYAFFEMEKRYGLRIECINDKVTLTFSDEVMNNHLNEWAKKYQRIKGELDNATSEKERAAILHKYDMWKWTYPQTIVDRSDKEIKEIRKAELEEQMRQIQKELSDLNNGE